MKFDIMFYILVYILYCSHVNKRNIEKLFSIVIKLKYMDTLPFYNFLYMITVKKVLLTRFLSFIKEHSALLEDEKKNIKVMTFLLKTHLHLHIIL